MGFARALTALLLTVAHALVHAKSTTVVSVTSTTTVIHATASDLANACNNFNGACVVYGDNDVHGAPYMTTVYRNSSPTPTMIVTSTTIVQSTTTATDTNACQGFNGACVIYAGNGEAASTTVSAGYRDGGAGQQQQHLGNADGYIAMHKGKAHAAVAAGTSLSALTWFGVMTCFGMIAGAVVL